jgi:serine/threonine protein kinase
MGSDTKKVRYLDLHTLLFRQAMNKSRLAPQIALRIAAAMCGRMHAAHVRKDDAGKPLNLVHGSIALPIVLAGTDGSVQVLKLPVPMDLQKSPEQAAGFPATVKSDIFNAGLVLYILLTGDHPLWRKNRDEMTSATIAAEIPPPSKVEHLPPSLDAVVMPALARNADERYPDMKAFQAAIEKALDVPGMNATAEEVGRLVETLLPPEDKQSDDPEALAALEKLADQLERVDARGVRSTQALRNLDLKAEKPRFQIDCFFIPDDEAPAAAQSPDALALYRQLEDLGFTRLGVKQEVDKLSGKKTPSIAFSSEAHAAFASIFFSFDAVPSLYFYTDFEDGSVVLTGCYPRRPHRKPRAVLTGIANQPIATVLEAHKKEVQAFLDKGVKVRPGWGQAERVRSTLAYYENEDTR